MKSKTVFLVILLVATMSNGGENENISDSVWKNVDLNVNSDAKIISDDPAPKFPNEATRKGKSGYVVVTFEVNEYGKTGDIKIVKESPVGIGFGPSVLKQVSELLFSPAVSKGKRVKQRFKRTYTFDQSSNGMSSFQSGEKEFKYFDLGNCTDPQVSFWASRVRRAAYSNADSISKVDSIEKSKCAVRFIVNRDGSIFNLEKDDCDIGYKSIKIMEHTPPLPVGFKPDTIMVKLEFKSDRDN